MSTPQTAGRASRFWLVLVVFVVGVLVGVSLDTMHPSAYAQIPDAGLQMNQLKTEMASLNAKVGDLIGLVKTQTFKVRIVQDEAGSGDKPVSRSSSPQGGSRSGSR